MDDLDNWSEQDVQKACKYGFVIAGGLIGGAFGGLASTTTAGVAAPLTVPAGAAYGAALGLGAGLLACKFVTREKVERLFSGRQMPLGDAKEVVAALGKVTGIWDKGQLWYLVSQIQAARSTGPQRCTPSVAGSQSAPAAARELIAWQSAQRVSIV